VPEKHTSIGFFKLTYGVLMAQVIKERMMVGVPQAICGLRGTEFEVSYNKRTKAGCVRVFEHSVWFSDIKKRKTVIVREGMRSCVIGDGIPSEPEPFKPIDVKGRWKSNFGTMVLKQSGSKVEGKYTHDKGKIEGTLKGNILTCRWSEAPSYMPKHDAGDCRLIFSPDGKSFTGKWRYGFGGSSWDGSWEGEKCDRGTPNRTLSTGSSDTSNSRSP